MTNEDIISLIELAIEEAEEDDENCLDYIEAALSSAAIAVHPHQSKEKNHLITLLDGRSFWLDDEGGIYMIGRKIA